MSLLQTIHQYLGYLIFVVVLLVALQAFRRARDSREFERRPYGLAMVALDVQVTLGLVLYVWGSYWDARPEIAYLHPLLSFAALGAGHALVGRAARTQMAVDAHRTAGRGLLLALLLVLGAIGVASAPAFL